MSYSVFYSNPDTQCMLYLPYIYHKKLTIHVGKIYHTLSVWVQVMFVSSRIWLGLKKIDPPGLMLLCLHGIRFSTLDLALDRGGFQQIKVYRDVLKMVVTATWGSRSKEYAFEFQVHICKRCCCFILFHIIWFFHKEIAISSFFCHALSGLPLLAWSSRSSVLPPLHRKADQLQDDPFQKFAFRRCSTLNRILKRTGLHLPRLVLSNKNQRIESELLHFFNILTCLLLDNPMSLGI